MAKSTHSGTCQCCGSLQKLPNGILSLHGYTVAKWGFFSGICHGARQLPFEISKDWSERALSMAKESLIKEQDLLTRPESLPKPMKVRGRDKYGNREVLTVFVKSVFVQGRKLVINHQHSVEAYCQSAEKWLADQQRFAVNTQQSRIAQLVDYIEWQTDRCANWAAHPEKLIPVDNGPVVHAKPIYKYQKKTACNSKSDWAVSSDNESEVTCKRCIKAVAAKAKEDAKISA